MAREIMKKILLAVISVLLMGCQQGVVYTEFASLPSAGWEADSVVCFTPVLTDTVGSYDMSIVMRHTDRYAYQNLWLFVDVKADSVVIRRDTINGMLADEQGNWYGKGMYIFELPLLYLQDVELPAGAYEVTLQQAMREDTLCGLTDIGLKVIKN